jgi:hypothetical protein
MGGGAVVTMFIIYSNRNVVCVVIVESFHVFKFKVVGCVEGNQTVATGRKFNIPEKMYERL